MADPNGKRDHPLVLVADDDTSVRIHSRASLEDAGFAVADAADGKTALYSL